jgi:hypothetical protein
MAAESASDARSKRVPLGKRLSQLALICAGSTATVSAIVNGAAAYWLIQSSDEELLGITRSEVLIGCSVIFVLGTLLLYLGIRSWRSTSARRQK